MQLRFLSQDYAGLKHFGVGLVVDCEKLVLDCSGEPHLVVEVVEVGPGFGQFLVLLQEVLEDVLHFQTLLLLLASEQHCELIEVQTVLGDVVFEELGSFLQQALLQQSAQVGAEVVAQLLPLLSLVEVTCSDLLDVLFDVPQTGESSLL